VVVFLRRKPAPTLSLWSVVGAADLHALAASGWTSWPQRGEHDDVLEAWRVRAEAVRLLRESVVPELGEGSLVVFDVPPDVLTWPGVQLDGERLLVPKGRRLTKAVIGDICEEAQYQRGVAQRDVDAVRDAFGELVPSAWRDMVSAPTWLRRGWMATGAYVDLHPPAEAIRVTQSWMREMVFHPGALVIGADGSRRHLVIDLREQDPPVHLVEDSSTGWDDTVVQARSVGELVQRLEIGDFSIVG
jgi:hypothetical protein